MAGLDKIIKHIEDDAAAVALAILTDAQSKAEEIVSAAKEQAQKKCEEIQKKTEADVDMTLNKAESAALLQERKLILNAKQELINEVIEHAKTSLTHLPEEDYFSIIKKMIKKYALPKKGEIIFSHADKNRLPANLEAELSSILSDIQGAELLISNETRKLDGGFILVYGDIEENCSFEALFMAAKESLQDKVYKFLFE
jgi:V/A-type H+-transporting ATPase subunit E